MPLNRAVKTNGPNRVLLAKLIFLRSYHDSDGRSMDGAPRKSSESSEDPNSRTEARMEGKLGPANSRDWCVFPRIATPIVGQNPVDGIGMAISGVCPGRLKIT